MLSTLLLKVPAWPSASARRGSKRCISSRRPPKAPKDMPPPMYLPSVVRSGMTPSCACRPPRDRREVITSSKTSSAPQSSARRRRPCRNCGRAGDAAARAEHRLDQDRGELRRRRAARARPRRRGRCRARAASRAARSPSRPRRRRRARRRGRRPRTPAPCAGRCAATARASAIRLASVPLLVKRSSSIDGKRCTSSRASSTSRCVCDDRLMPSSSAATTASRIGWAEWPYSPAVNSPSASSRRWPSASHSQQPSPRTITGGKGDWNSTLRVLPPGSTSAACSSWRALDGQRSR